MSRVVVFVLLLLIVAGGVLVAPSSAYGQGGVGINISEIRVDERLVPGGIYKLPQVTVFNTGSDGSEYTLNVAYVFEQEEQLPPKEWFSFSPNVFHLEPDESQIVAITLTVPVKARPGSYFAYIQAKGAPGPGGVGIAVAAAARLYFDVRPANLLVAITTRVEDLFNQYSPGSYIGVGLLGVALIALAFRRFFRIRFRVERK